MPRLHLHLILIAILLFFVCSGVTIRDRILVSTLHRLADQSLVAPSEKLLFEGAMNGMVRSIERILGDEYASYIPQEDQKKFENSLDNRFDGIGIVYKFNKKEELPEISYPVLDSPAYHAGIQSGDKILSIDGHETKGRDFYEISKIFSNSSHQIIPLTLRRGDNEMQISVKRGMIQRDSVEGDGIDESGKRIFQLAGHPEIGYIKITSFSDRTFQEMQNAIQSLEKENVKGLILDLRGNPGGYVSTAVDIAGLFLSPTNEMNTIVSTRLREGIS
ncbi:MAG: S41 family peptidase, partial [Thermoguttaceae bacterium]